MKMKCKFEAHYANGEKIMNFTKDNIYDFIRIDGETWTTFDDDGKQEDFFNLDVMFESL